MDSTHMDVTFDLSDLEGTDYLDFMEEIENVSDEHNVSVSGLWF